MKKSVVLLATLASLVACSGDKKEEGAEASTEATCQVETTPEATTATVKHEEAAPVEAPATETAA